MPGPIWWDWISQIELKIIRTNCNNLYTTVYTRTLCTALWTTWLSSARVHISFSGQHSWLFIDWFRLIDWFDLVSHPFSPLNAFCPALFFVSRVKWLIFYSSINDSKTEELQLGTIDYEQRYNNSTINPSPAKVENKVSS
jgi:hypothetical protein